MLYSQKTRLVVVIVVDYAKINSGTVLDGHCIRRMGHRDLYDLPVTPILVFFLVFFLVGYLLGRRLIAFGIIHLHVLVVPEVENILGHVP